MSGRAGLKWGWLVAIAILIPIHGSVATPAPELPSSDWVLSNVLARAKSYLSNDVQRLYSYLKVTSTEEFDPDGKVLRKRDKSVQVIPSSVGGAPVRVAVAERILSLEELEEIAASQADQGVSPRKKKKRKNPKLELSEELINRFQFDLVDREIVDGRPTFHLTFAPKTRDLPVNQLQDYLLNKAIGSIWVDESEFEIVRADVRLGTPVSVAGGLVGAVQRFHYILERVCLEPGVWLVKKTDLTIRARQFLTPIHTRKQEVWSHFAKPVS